MNWMQISRKKPSLKGASISTSPITPETAWQVMHAHAYFEIGMVLQGQCTWKTSEGSYCLNENDIILLPPGCKHKEVIPATNSPRIGWVSFSLSKGLTQLPVITLSSGQWSPEIRRLFMTLHDEQQSHAFGRELRIELCLRELMVLITRILHEKDSNTYALPFSSGQSVGLVHRATVYMENHLSHPLSMETLAALFHITPQYFSMLFRTTYGIPPIQFLQQTRHRTACRWLSDSGRSVKEIAVGCGYPNISNFCRQFKKRQGCTPLHYRKTYWQQPPQGEVNPTTNRLTAEL